MHFFDFNPKHIPALPEGRLGAVDEIWEGLVSGCGADDAAAEGWRAARENPGIRALLGQVFALSPFLTHCIKTDAGFALEAITAGVDAAGGRVIADTRALGFGDDGFADEAGLMKSLRIFKRRAQLVAALGDISGLWELEQVCGLISDFADASVSAVARHLLAAMHERGTIKLPHPENPEFESGLVILGMGKLGGRELNYSSDIDIIVMFDREKINSDNPDEIQPAFVRLARKMVSMLDDRTADGYVFRTDLRLRPDPGSTPLAISTIAAESYYESIGQNWERAAMIKARPIAGDIAAGDAFIRYLKPFIWRKNLDFAAIDDIHSIKRQINAHRGGGKVDLFGHNLKLGRGGIREIEFFAQTQQLIWGGRNRKLRVAPSMAALDELVAAGKVTPENCQKLKTAYRFLRKAEHRLQMINDEQTHTLPDNETAMEDVGRFMGYADPSAFGPDVISTLQTVEGIYARLFEESPSLGASGEESGNLVFTGGESDPETLKTIEKLGFGNPGAVDATVRGWHHGRYRSTRSTRAREILTELMPVLLAAFGRCSEADAAFMRFDEFLARLPAGVQLFSMFQANPALLDMIAEIMGSAPRLAEHMAKKAGIIDSLLGDELLNPPPTRDEMALDLAAQLIDASCIEEALDTTRRWAKDRKFQIGLQVLRGTIDERSSQRALSDVADALISTLQPRVEEEFAASHGRVKGGAMAVVAYGKYGGQEKTPTSDLDLIFIYDFDRTCEQSDGPKPLAPSQYFSRLSQRMINALSAPTAEGSLYEIDMRLRPSGSSGPIASTIGSFTEYQQKDAWTWEHMALTRARVVCGPDELVKKCSNAIRDILTRARDADKLLGDVYEMRERIFQEHGSDSPWEIKHYRGGMVDIEFICQYLQLRHAHDHPEILSANTLDAIERIGRAGLLDGKTTDGLCRALELWQSIQGMVRLTIVYDMRKRGSPEMPESLAKIFCRIAGVDSMQQLEQKMLDTAKWVEGRYAELISNPASALPKKPDEK